MSVIFVLSIKRKHFRIFILHYSINLYNTYEKFEEANGEPKPANKKKTENTMIKRQPMVDKTLTVYYYMPCKTKLT